MGGRFLFILLICTLHMDPIVLSNIVNVTGNKLIVEIKDRSLLDSMPGQAGQ